MLANDIEYFVSLHSDRKVYVYLHTSVILAKDAELRELKNLKGNVSFFITASCVAELELLAENKLSEGFARRANIVLKELKCGVVKGGHKELIEAEKNIKNASEYRLFVFLEPAIADNFSKKFGHSDNVYVLSYDPYRGASGSSLIRTGNIIKKRCIPLREAKIPGKVYDKKKGGLQRIVFSDANNTVIDYRTLTAKGVNGTTVYTADRLEYFNRGGEADILRVKGTNELIKIYRKYIPDGNFEKKIDLLMRSTLRTRLSPVMAMPTALVYASGKFVGFKMDKADIEEMLPRLDKCGDRKEKGVIIKDLLSTLLVLRLSQIVPVDISPKNILMKNGKTFFIDCDSMEIVYYPGGGFTRPFVHPEFAKGKKPYFDLRECDHVNFSLAVFMFKVFLGWDNPISQGNLPDGRDADWSKDKFPFSNRSILGSGCQAPGTVTRSDMLDEWKKQPYSLRCSFIDAFTFNYINDIGDWLSVLKKSNII